MGVRGKNIKEQRRGLEKFQLINERLKILEFSIEKANLRDLKLGL